MGAQHKEDRRRRMMYSGIYGVVSSRGSAVDAVVAVKCLNLPLLLVYMSCSLLIMSWKEKTAKKAHFATSSERKHSYPAFPQRLPSLNPPLLPDSIGAESQLGDDSSTAWSRTLSSWVQHIEQQKEGFKTHASSRCSCPWTCHHLWAGQCALDHLLPEQYR